MEHKLSKIGIISGIVIIICSIIRWFFMWYDPSQLILSVSIGIIVCGFAYMYNWMKNKDVELRKMEKRVDAVVDWWTKHEIK